MKRYRVIETIDMTKWQGMKDKAGNPLIVRYSGVDMINGKELSKDHPLQSHKGKIEKDWHRNYILKNEEVTVSESEGRYYIHRQVTQGVEASFVVGKELFEILFKQLEAI